MKNMKSACLAAPIGLLLASTALSPAYAQNSQAEQEANVSDVVVTGSRIVRDGYQAPTPTTVASVEELAIASPQSITEGLTKLPVFAGSGGAAGSGGRGPGQGGTIGTGSFLNLRNFSPVRTLVLLDGRRVAPTSYDGSVDTTSLPQALVQRVDIVTGGASAVYGSDAVTGVVNFVLDHRFTGLRGLVQGGISDRSDGETQRYNIAGGAPLFGGRGHVIGSLEYSRHDGIPRKEDREFGQHGYLVTGRGTAANPYRIIENARQSTSAFGGLITSGPLAGMTFNPDGTLRVFDVGTPTGTSGISSGGDGTYHPDVSLMAAVETQQAFGRFQYEFAPNLTGFVQASYSEGEARHTQATGNRSSGSTSRIRIYSGNPYLRPEVQQVLTDTGTDSFILSSYALDMGRPEFITTTESFNTTVGLEGRLLDRYRWDASYTRSVASTRLVTLRNNANVPFYAAVDAVRAPNGDIVCRVTLTNPGLYPGCVPINPMGRGNASPESIAYTTETTWWEVENVVDDFAANITGDLFEGWAGPISFALGVEYRSSSLDQTTSHSPTDLPTFDGLRGGFTVGQTLSHVGRLVAPSQGSNDVWEVNAETVVPLLTDAPLARSLEFNGAVRYTNYSDSGGATTWKLGLNWQPIDDLRFRLVRSRDIRAPTLYDLYAGLQVTNNAFTDDLTGVVGTLQIHASGNPNLTPEIADTVILGAIYSPSSLPGLNISLDYYEIHVDDAIGEVSSAVANRECIRANGNSPFCGQIVRPGPITDTSPGNYPTMILSQPLNIAESWTHGVDLELGYRFDLDSWAEALAGAVDLRLMLSYQPVLKTIAYENATVLNAAGVAGLSDTRLTLRASYTLNGLSVNAQTRWNNGGVWNADRTLVYEEPDFGSYSVTDLNVSYDFTAGGRDLTAFLTIGNVFDRDPDIMPGTSAPGHVTPIVSGHDFMGRYYTLGLRFTL